MSSGLIVFLLLFLALIFYVIFLYNQLVSLKNHAKKAWSNIEIVLKQRNDELPKLVDTCKHYMHYEKETLEKITQARQKVMSALQGGHVEALGSAEDFLRGSLGQLFAVAENYPELKASEHFQHLQGRITGLEESIADRREFYNESATINNIRIEQFPDNIIAGLFAFRPFKLLHFSTQEKRDINIGQLFQS